MIEAGKNPCGWYILNFKNANTAVRIRFSVWVVSCLLMLCLIYACTPKVPSFLNSSTGTIVENTDEEMPFQAMDSFNPETRASAARDFGNIGPIRNQHMFIYLNTLKQPSQSERLAVIDKMDDMVANMEPVIDVLCNGTTDIDARVRFESIVSLGLIATELNRPVKLLEKFMSDASVSDDKNIEALSEASYHCLGSILARTMTINKALRVCLIDGDPKVKKTAENVLETIADGQIVNREPDDVDYTVKVQTAEVDARPKADTIIPTDKIDGAIIVDEDDELNFPEMDGLLRKLEDFERPTRRFTMGSIGLLVEKELKNIPEHTSAIKEGEITIRTESAQFISDAAAKMKRAARVLERTMDDSDSEVRAGAAKSLGQILVPLSRALIPLYNTPREIEEALNKENVVPDTMVQINLEKFKDTTGEAIGDIDLLLLRGIHVLVRGLEDEDYQVRTASAKWLKHTIPPSVLMVGEKSEVPRVWQEFFITLGENQQDLYVRLLVNDLGNNSLNIARKSAKALGDLGPLAKKALPALIKVIGDKEKRHVHYKYVKIEAIKAVGKMGADAKQAVPVLIEQLNDIRFEIRQNAVITLGQIGAKEAAHPVLNLFEHDSSTVVREAAISALPSLDAKDCLDRAYTALLKALKDPSGDTRFKAFNVLVSYEIKNRGQGAIKWKPYIHPVLGYRVCLLDKNKKKAIKCFETGQVTAFRLGDLPIKLNGTDRIQVQAVQVTGTRDMDFIFVDIPLILQKSSEIEADPIVKNSKEKALLVFWKSLEKMSRKK